MLKSLTPLLLLAICFMCMGCPFGSPYALDEQPKEKIRSTLLGRWRWTNEKDSVYYTFDINRKNDYEYRILIMGNLKTLIQTWAPERDSIAVSGFTTTVDGNLFMNVLSQTQYYLVHVKLEEGLLSLMPLSDQFSFAIIRNSQALKQLLSAYMKVNVPFYDQQTIIKGLVRER